MGGGGRGGGRREKRGIMWRLVVRLRAWMGDTHTHILFMQKPTQTDGSPKPLVTWKSPFLLLPPEDQTSACVTGFFLTD